MTRMLRSVPLLVYLVPLLVPSAAPAQPAAVPRALTIVNAGPTGELASLGEANEIRVVFSEPMVALGRIPSPVRAPFFRISPEVPGTFRWSGTTILIYTPDPRRPLPFSTRYEVTIDTTAVAVSGRRPAQAFTFSFTTPTARLLRTSWYRRNDRANAPAVVLLRFNQPVRGEDVLGHLRAAFEPHDWVEPVIPTDVQQLVNAADPTALGRFHAKVAATRAVAAASGPVQFRLTDDWDRKVHPPGPDLVVLESTTSIPSESWVRLVLDERLPSPAGAATPGVEQSYTIEVEPAFFVDGFDCRMQCDPDRRNPVIFRNPVRVSDFAAAARVADITDRPAPRPVGKSAGAASPREYELDEGRYLTIEDAGFESQPPARTYAVTLSANLRAADGQTLGYTWVGTVGNWHQRSFTSFGDGHGVWETGAGTQLPFYARNFLNVRQWAAPIDPANLMSLVRKLQPEFRAVPPGQGTDRRLGGAPDRIQSHGLDMSAALRGRSTGLVWAAVREGDPIPESYPYGSSRERASIVQVTNLGITVKDSPRNTLVMVTRLDTGEPVAGAKVSIVRVDEKVFWSGLTGPDGVVVAPETPLRKEDDWWQFAFIVTAEKDGDVAYVGSDWHEGILPWEFGAPFNLSEASPLLRGSVFSDRGVYRLGEQVHLKAILRHNAAEGIRLLPEGTPLSVTLRDSQYRIVEERSVKVGPWSSAEWQMTLPADGALGHYSLQVVLASDRPQPRAPEDLRPGETPGPEADANVPYTRVVSGSFLVAAYRRPDFRVDVTLTADTPPIAGADLKGVITARYLFGAQMGARPLRWTLSASPVSDAPTAVREAFPEDRWLFVGWSERSDHDRGEIRRDETRLTAAGERALTLPTPRDAGVPYSYTLEGDVEDVSRQHIANRASLTVHPAPWYVGIRRPAYFVEQTAGLATEVVTVTPDGRTAAGVPVTVSLTQVQWISVRRAEGNGFYTWDTERREVPAGTWTVTTADAPVPLQIPVPSGGYFLLEAVAREDGGRYAVTRTSFYALGEGYTAWARFDHNRIELVPERRTYKPGDTARIMIQSPWEHATALLTTEREGIRTHRRFTLTSTQQSISVPITEADIPNVYVSVLLVKGRTRVEPGGDPAVRGGPHAIEDPSDPGKPAFRVGYVELKVEDSSKRLTVNVTANRTEYRPANTAKVRLSVSDRAGRGARSEVTLWAVDYGVLSLTGYRTPDVLGSVYVEKALQVLTTDNRQRIISRRVLTPKGETDGGGGGADPGAGTLRRDFRVLAFWLGSVITDGSGRASVDVKLPESLTTYRIMAVAADRGSRFGSGETEVRVNKPLTLKPTFPRFLAVGDTAYFGAVVTSQLPDAGDATVTIRSLDPAVLEFTGPAQSAPMAAGGSLEVRFAAAARRVGRARVQMTVRMGKEADAFEDAIPVEILVSPETVASSGEAGREGAVATETLTIPASVVPGFGGLRVDLSSTALVGLGEGARYLVEYPYGCAEQRASRTVAMVLASDLGDAFSLPGVDTAKVRPAAQQSIRELERYQCPSGAFAYWPGRCWSASAYLTSYVLHVLGTAAGLKYDVRTDVLRRAYDYLERELGTRPPVNEGWWPSYTAWQAFAVKVLVDAGRNQDSHLNRLYGYRDRMPVFALAYLHDALLAQGAPASAQNAARLAELRRRMSNAIVPEAGSAHVEELSDPYLLWFWNSNVRSTAIVLNTLVRSEAPKFPIREMVRWLMAARKDGRWGNTQENAHAMEALVAYYRRHEAVVPDFRAVVELGARPLLTEEFRGRSTETVSHDVPMQTLVATGEPGRREALTFRREGAGTLFYTARLRYAADDLFQQGLDSGFHIERSYAPLVDEETSSGSTAAAGGPGEAADRASSGASRATMRQEARTTYEAGELVRVTLRFHLTKERRYVAVTDPLPAGFEAVESWFATTSASLSARQDDQGDVEDNWFSWWQRGGFDHVERHDDRIQLFATRLSEGVHEFSYIARATTAGTFRTAPARAEEMYEPEVFGRTATTVIEIKR